MNGLANAILTMLLSWLRVIVNRIWSLVNSESGGQFFTFLANNWVKILLVLGIGGFLLDKLIYLIRWRPFSVRRRRMEQQQEAQTEPQIHWSQEPEFNPYANAPEPVSKEPVYAEPVYEEPVYAEPVSAEEAGMLFDPQRPVIKRWDESTYPVTETNPIFDTTAAYATVPVDHSAYRPPMDDIEPVFDEQATWAGADSWLSTPEPLTPIVSVPPAVHQPAPAANAPLQPPPPLFAPIEPPIAETQPVHPGLDRELLRRNMGLTDSDAAPAEEPLAMNFTPFTRQAEVEPSTKKPRNPFMNLMRLVGDEAAKPSIRDLQSSVDVRNAFREPVYPKPLHRNEDDPT